MQSLNEPDPLRLVAVSALIARGSERYVFSKRLGAYIVPQITNLALQLNFLKVLRYLGVDSSSTMAEEAVPRPHVQQAHRKLASLAATGARSADVSEFAVVSGALLIALVFLLLS